ncbi:MAG: hypothetical protein RID93_40405, partial [Sandaracinaceae bacterium]
IARVVIRDRRILRSLGFLRPVRRADGTEVDVIVDDDVDTDTPDPTLVHPIPEPVAPDPISPEPEPLEA